MARKKDKLSGLKADGTPNLYWQRFKKRLNEFENIKVCDWEDEEVLGYLLKRYKDHYEIEYGLSYSGPPSKCSEMYCIRRMNATVGTTKGEILKDYIDWIFDANIIAKEKEIVSLGYFFHPGLCSQYRTIFRTRNKVTKTTTLPETYIIKASDFGISISTYGDLAFAKMAIDRSPEDYPEYTALFASLKELGFSDLMLNNLGA